jgi:predicted signal transduction protein with EAL and GGDEF domain
VRASDSVSRHEAEEGFENTARLGGDEFTVLLPEVRRSEDAAAVADRILRALSQPLTLADHEVLVTPSIGIAIYPQDGDDPDTLITNADTAMYHAKRQGRNQYRFYDATLNEAALRRLRMETQLRKAVERNELRVHYQPQVDLESGHACGVEALVRWQSPVLGAVSPADFIPLAEESGLIVGIGEWVLRQACAQARTWRDDGIALERMAVNISVLQFVQPGFVELVRAILQETGLEAGALELEVTESLLMKDPDGAVRTLNELKAIGVQLAIDDFGTGYSSLSRLKQLPIDRLKIDRSFVRDVPASQDDVAIAMAVIAMAGSMGLKVVAEGVETAEQLEFLREKRCDEVQGYLLSRPVPVPEATDFLRRAGDARRVPSAQDLG